VGGSKPGRGRPHAHSTPAAKTLSSGKRCKRRLPRILTRLVLRPNGAVDVKRWSGTLPIVTVLANRFACSAYRRYCIVCHQAPLTNTIFGYNGRNLKSRLTIGQCLLDGP